MRIISPAFQQVVGVAGNDERGVRGATIPPNCLFTLEIKPPTGSYMVLQRSTPPVLQPFTLLN